LPYPAVTDPEAPPIRPERHVPTSIATLRRRLTVALARSLVTMSMLRRSKSETEIAGEFVTQ